MHTPISALEPTPPPVNGYRVALTTHPQSSAQVEEKNTALPLLPLWAFMTCPRVNLPSRFPSVVRIPG